MPHGCSLSKAYKGLREANLSKHAISGYRLLLGSVEKNMGLSFSILIVVICGTIRVKSGIVDGQIR
jgi:hypothetical protein